MHLLVCNVHLENFVLLFLLVKSLNFCSSLFKNMGGGGWNIYHTKRVIVPWAEVAWGSAGNLGHSDCNIMLVEDHDA
jgi:hypothetical protein